jgi:acyl carrier protein
MIRQILKLGKDEPMNDDENFQDLGMDSLMMIEMKNVVQSTLGKRATITVNSVKDCHTVNQLATKLCNLLTGDDEDSSPTPTREELHKLIREDSILPESISSSPLPACLPSQIKTILLTGVTGNMGPYFLKDIAERKEITKIYCLIREDKGVSIKKKLEKKLSSKGLLESVDMSKVEIVSGQITRPKFGLSDQAYQALAEKVDAVVHLAVKSNFVDDYKKIDRQDSRDIRSVNLKSTLNILEFNTTHKNKVLLHASTIVANTTLACDNSLSESWPLDGDFNEMPGTAYPVSKFVCDRLMAQAVEERGLPVKVFRYFIF